MDKERCLLCQCKIEDSSSPKSPLEVIFLLRKVLGVPEHLLSEFRRGCIRVEGWISVCAQCQALVKKCHQIYEQLCQLTRKWSEGQARIRGMIRNVKVDEEEDAEVVVLDIGRVVRDWVLSSEERQEETDVPVTAHDDVELERVYHELTSSPQRDAQDPLAEEADEEEESDGDWEWETPDTRNLGPTTPPTPAPPPKPQTAIEKMKAKYPDTFRPTLWLRSIFLESEVRLRCPVPGCSFTHADPQDVDSLSRHQKDGHTAQELASLPQNPFTMECLKCHMIFNMRCTLRRHLEKRHAPGVAESSSADQIRCPVAGCSIVCPTTRALTNHKMHSHTKAERDAIPKSTKLFECPDCRKRFRLPQALRKHQPIHSSDKKQAICDVCGTAVRDPEMLQKHKKDSITCRRLQGQTLERKHQCPECGKGFVTPKLLRIHVKQRHHSTPLPCTECGKALTNKHALSAHMASFHGQGDFLCPECGRVFSKQTALDFHVDYIHKGIGGFFCGEGKCGRRFPNRKLLQNHVNREHLKGEPEYKCGECGKGFYTTGNLSQHRALVHRGKKMKRNRKKSNRIK